MKQPQTINSHSITEMHTGLQPLMPLIHGKAIAELRENSDSAPARDLVAALLAMKALRDFNAYSIFSLKNPQPTADAKKQASHAQNVQWLASSEIVAGYINNDTAQRAITGGIATLQDAIAHAETRDGVSPETLRADVATCKQGMGTAVEETIAKMRLEITRADAAAARTAEAQVGYAARRAAALQEQQRLAREQLEREREANERIATSREQSKLAARNAHAAALDAKARRLVEAEQGSGAFTQRVAAAGISPEAVQQQGNTERSL